MTIDEIRALDNEQLYYLSLQKYESGKRKGSYTNDAYLAYTERQRRAGVCGSIGGGYAKPNKYTADIDYYGFYSARGDW